MQNSLDPHYPMYICAFFLVLFLFLFSPPLFLASEDFKRGSDLEKRLGWQRRLNEAVLNSRMEGGRGKGKSWSYPQVVGLLGVDVTTVR